MLGRLPWTALSRNDLTAFAERFVAAVFQADEVVLELGAKLRFYRYGRRSYRYTGIPVHQYTGVTVYR